MSLTRSAIGVLIFCAFPVNAQVPQFSAETVAVRGSIDNVAAGHFLVELESRSAAFHGQRTDVGVQGTFSFMGVPLGQYSLIVTDIYGNVVHREFVEVQRAMGPISIRLRETRKEPVNGGTISLRRLQHKVPKAARKLFEKAEKAAEKGDAAASISLLQQAVEKDPEYMEAWVNLGARQLKTNDPASALKAFEKAIALDEGMSLPYSNSATALLMLGKPAEAEAAARKAIERDPLNVRARYMLGIALVQQAKDIPEALENLERACEQFPAARIVLAQVLSRQGNTEQAKGELEAYLASDRVENREQIEKWLNSLNRRLDQR
jgi:tetratricopeptide (TPR) repeat protein